MTTFDKFRNCIIEPRCRDCEGIPGVCEVDHQSVSIPKALALDVLNTLKEQDERIGALTRAIKHMPKLTKLLDVYGDGYAKVVRCENCKHGNLYCTEDVCGETLIECNRPDLGDVIEIHGWKWFCADGERKGE